jgi:hypothetical protein
VFYLIFNHYSLPKQFETFRLLPPFFGGKFGGKYFFFGGKSINFLTKNTKTYHECNKQTYRANYKAG